MKRHLLETYLSCLVEMALVEQNTPPPVPAAAMKRQAGTVSLTPLGGNWETGNIQQDAQKVVTANSARLAKKGINIANLKVLGVGTMGVAYDLGDKVLKVTKDAREAKTSNVVKGKTVPNIVQVYDIWQFPNTNWFGLIIEKLTPLSKEEEKQLTDGVINTMFPVLLANAKDDWNVAMQQLAQQSMRGAVKQAYEKFPDAEQGQGIKDPRVQQFIKPIVQKKIADFDKLTKEYNMRGLFKSLKSLGVQYYDFHGGNYGRRADGTLVLFDLGRSISQGAMPPTLQEEIRRTKISFLED